MKDFLSIIFLVILSSILYLLTIKGVYGNINVYKIKNYLDTKSQPFELSPERNRYLLVYSLAENRSFSLTEDMAEIAGTDIGYFKGKYYIFFAPGVSLFALPFYLAGKYFNLSQVLTYSMVSFFAILSIVFIFLICRNIFKFPRWISTLCPLVFAFGSVSWSYAVTLYQHNLTAFFILSSFYAVWKFKKKAEEYIYGSYIWFCYGLAIFVDYPNSILMLPIIIYFLISSVGFSINKNILTGKIKLSFISSALFLIILGLMHGYYNYKNFGDWKKLSASLPSYSSIKKIEQTENTQPKKEEIKKAEERKKKVVFFKEENLNNGFYTLFFSSDRGLFFYSPIFILGFLGLYFVSKKMSLEHNILLSVILTHSFLYSSWLDPWGGWAYGPRYLIPMTAVLSIFIGFFLLKIKNVFIGKVIIFLAFSYSLLISLLGVLTTNAVPPKIEADYLGVDYNFFYNFDLFQNGISSSFIYNNYFSTLLNLGEYFVLIYLSILVIFYFILFILPGKIWK